MAFQSTSSCMLFAFLLYLLSFTSSALSSSFATSQLKFWSDNVRNSMPPAISSKLSPLNKLDTVHYANAISQPNFQADTKFCLLAKLACSTLFDEIKKVKEACQVEKTYNENKVSISIDKVDPFSFFRLSMLKEGSTIHLSNLEESLPYRAFLPPQIASRISLTQRGISNMFPDSSSQAIHTTLSYCNAAPIKGESKACPKSLEEMISFSKTALGEHKLLALTSKSTEGLGTQVKIKKIEGFDAARIVACHEMFLPFATYFCHALPSSKIYSVDMVEPRTGAPINTAMAICHMDTSPWPANHVAFQILKFHPGQGEACHWLNEIDLAWIAAAGED